MPVLLRSTVIGVFDTHPQAHQAVEELRRAGFHRDDIAVVMHRKEGVEVTDVDAAKAAQVTGETKAEEGVAAGAIAGGLVGGLMGLIPGVGAILSFGALAGSLFGIAAGAVGGGIVGALVGMDFPEEEARYYEQQLKAGKVLVGVKAGDRNPEATEILRRCGATDASDPHHAHVTLATPVETPVAPAVATAESTPVAPAAPVPTEPPPATPAPPVPPPIPPVM